jgi:type IV pilus assembly protein PilV
MLMKFPTPLVRCPAERGFSMVEVLVTILILALGFLGLAKMQAAGVSNTQVSRVRSLLALQAASLGATMRGNKAYWGTTPPTSFSVTGGQVTDNSSVLTATASCAETTNCTPAKMAAFEVQAWAGVLNARFPSARAAVSCTPPVTTTPASPANCRIVLEWDEKYMAINRSTAASATALTGTQTLTLYVEP